MTALEASTADHVDLSAEEAVLGALLLWPGGMSSALESGLRPHHFYKVIHGQVFSAMMGLTERGLEFDHLVVVAELKRMNLLSGRMIPGTDTPEEAAGVDYLTGAVPAVGNLIRYAEIVIRMADWRARRTAVLQLNEAIQKMSPEDWGRAMVALEAGSRERRKESYGPEQWADAILEWITTEGDPPAIPLPWPRMTEAMGGGLQPGESMILAGYTNHGKSIVADQCLDAAGKAGYRGHCYMTEMTAVNRGLRLLSRRTGIPYLTMRRRRMDAQQKAAILTELGKVDYGVSIVTDWEIDEVVRDALRSRYDFIVIDLIHGFHYEDERGLDRISKALGRIARVSTTLEGHNGTAVMGVAHLNESQMTGSRSAARPRPGMQSLKGGSSLKQDADFVMFVWQQDDEMGLPTGVGQAWLPKPRSGAPVTVDIQLNPRRFRFDVVDKTEQDAAAQPQETEAIPF